MSNTEISRDFALQLDELKTFDLVNGEVWSARDLMPHAGYTEWRNWLKAINRTVSSVEASGLNVDDHFVGVNKMVDLGSGSRREVQDIQLTRYACYLLFQNADGSKPEVARAQQYFAVQTRAAEVSSRETPSGAELIALAVIEAQTMLAAKDEQIAELTPKADAWEGLASGKGTYAVSDAAKMLQQVGIETGRDRLFEFLFERGWVYRQSGRWQAAQRAVDAKRLTHKPQSHKHPETGERVLDAPQVRVTMKGLYELRALMLPPIQQLTAVEAVAS